MTETKFLVNGKPMTKEQYIKLLEDARNANLAYKNTPEFTSEKEQKRQDALAKEENFAKILKFAQNLKLTSRQIGLIGYKLYLESKEEAE